MNSNRVSNIHFAVSTLFSMARAWVRTCRERVGHHSRQAFAHFQSQLQTLHTEQKGQATAEYSLVLLGAAAVALLLVAWATKSGMIAKLLDAVVNQLIDKAG